MDPRQIESTIEWLKAKRQPHEMAIQDAQALFLPHREAITTKISPGMQRVPAAYDSTGANAADALVNYLVGSVFPPTGDWRRIDPWQGERTGEVGERLDLVEEKLGQVDDNSNFYEAAIMSLKDLWVIGNSTFYQEEITPSASKSLFFDNSGFVGLSFEAVQFSNVYRHLDRHGNILALAHYFCMTGIEVEDFFGPGSSKGGDPDDKFDVWRVAKKVDGDRYEMVWFSSDLGMNRSTVENFSRYTAHRLDRIGNEQYAVGRGHIGRPTAAGMNELKRQLLSATGRTLTAPVVVENESVLRTERANGGQVVLRENPSFQPYFLQQNVDYQGAELIRQSDQRQIERAFMSDILLDPETQPRSSEESRLRQARLTTRIAGPTQSVKRWLTAIEQTKILHMAEAGQLPELDGIPGIRPVFTSPFFVQQRQAAIQKVVDFVQLKVALANAAQDPAILDDVDFDRVSSYLQKHSDVPSEILRTDDLVQQLRVARADREGTQVGLEQAALASQILGDQEVPQDGVPAEGVF